jgi:hypothetical protein
MRRSLPAELAARDGGTAPEHRMRHMMEAFASATTATTPVDRVTSYEVQIHELLNLKVLDGERLVLRAVDGRGAVSADVEVASWLGCTSCKAHPLVVGGDWLNWAAHKVVCKELPANVLSFHDLGREPPDAIKDAAVEEHHRLMRLLTPCCPIPSTPAYVDGEGVRQML